MPGCTGREVPAQDMYARIRQAMQLTILYSRKQLFFPKDSPLLLQHTPQGRTADPQAIGRSRLVAVFFRKGLANSQ